MFSSENFAELKRTKIIVDAILKEKWLFQIIAHGDDHLAPAISGRRKIGQHAKQKYYLSRTMTAR
jgi:hypothetical protein